MIDWVRNSTKYPSLKLKVVIIRRLEIICWTFKTTSAASRMLEPTLTRRMEKKMRNLTRDDRKTVF